MKEETKGSHTETLDGLKTDVFPQDIESDLDEQRRRIKLYKARRFQIILIGILVAFIAFFILLAPNFVGYRFGFYPFELTVIFVIIILIGISVAFFAAIIFYSLINSLESSFEELQAKLRVANQLSEERSFSISAGEGSTIYFTPSNGGGTSSLSSLSSPYFFNKLVNINLQNLEAYYVQVKAQTNKSFTASIVAGAVGFILISIGLILGFTNTANSQILLYISSGSGVVTEFIAAIFFYLYNRTVRQMKGYHDSLLNVQNILLSLKLVEDTKEEEIRAKMIEKMLEYLVGNQVFKRSPTGSKED